MAQAPHSSQAEASAWLLIRPDMARHGPHALSAPPETRRRPPARRHPFDSTGATGADALARSSAAARRPDAVQASSGHSLHGPLWPPRVPLGRARPPARCPAGARTGAPAPRCPRSAHCGVGGDADVSLEALASRRLPIRNRRERDHAPQSTPSTRGALARGDGCPPLPQGLSPGERARFDALAPSLFQRDAASALRTMDRGGRALAGPR